MQKEKKKRTARDSRRSRISTASTPTTGTTTPNRSIKAKKDVSKKNKVCSNRTKSKQQTKVWSRRKKIKRTASSIAKSSEKRNSERCRMKKVAPPVQKQPKPPVKMDENRLKQMAARVTGRRRPKQPLKPGDMSFPKMIKSRMSVEVASKSEIKLDQEKPAKLEKEPPKLIKSLLLSGMNRVKNSDNNSNLFVVGPGGQKIPFWHSDALYVPDEEPFVLNAETVLEVLSGAVKLATVPPEQQVHTEDLDQFEKLSTLQDRNALFEKSLVHANSITSMINVTELPHVQEQEDQARELQKLNFTIPENAYTYSRADWTKTRNVSFAPPADK